MPDRETVIRHLQIIRTWAAVGKEPIYHGIEPRCCEDVVKWADDALALLREQGPRVAQWQDSFDVPWQECTFCGVAVKKSAIKWVKASEDSNLNYCPHCGARMIREVKPDADHA